MKSISTPLFRVIITGIMVIAGLNMLQATTFTVTNLNDSGVGSLRQAITDANAAGAGPHTINFAVSGTIPIASALPAIANSGITIDGGGAITINAQGGDINRDIFTINASNTTIKGFTVQNTGTQCFEVAGNLSDVTIQDIIANHTANVMDNVVYVNGASTNMTIKNVMCLSGMQDGFRAFHFQGGTQTNLLLEDITLNCQYQGIYFQDASVNNLDIINATIYGSYDHIYFNNTGGPVETANDVTIDGENTASMYSQRDGAGTGMIFSNYINTNWQIKNILLDGDRANTTNDGNFGIRFGNTATGITIDNVQLTDFDIYAILFSAAATNITISNSSYTIPNIGDNGGTQAIRFENTVTLLNINNVTLDMDQPGTTDDSDYGIVFGYGYQKTDININNLTVNEADGDGIYVDGPVTNFTLTNSTLTSNYDGIEFYNGYNHNNLNITNSTFTGQTRSAILINTASATNSGTISGNTISNNGSNGLWFYSGDGNKAYTVTNNTISYNGGAGIYVNAGPDKINITQNSIFRNTGNGIELDGGGNLSYEGTNRPTITGSSETAPNSGDYNVTISLPTICNAAGGCTVEVFANASSDDVEGHHYVQTFTGLTGGTHNLLVDMCAVSPCLSLPTGFWTATLKVVNTGSVSEFSNKQTMKTQGPAAVNSGVALWLDAQDALSGNLPNGTGWQDRSGNDRDFDMVFGAPNRSTSGLNYNHYVQFNGGSYLRSTKSPFVNGFTAGEVIVVTRAYYRNLNQGNPYDLGGSSRGFHYSWGDEAVYNGFGTNDRLGWRPATQQILDGKPGVSSITGTRLDIREWNIFQTYSAAGSWGTGFNGQFVATTGTNTANFSLAGGNEHIGAVSGAIFYGDIAEVVMYSRTLTTAERQKINSYLALKYGTSLDQIAVNQDYYASDWNGTTGTRMWQNDNDGYEWNIFGIGRDDDSGLQQKQSESTEQNAILSVAIGSSIAAYNDQNTASITNDRSFLTFADNNQLQRFGPAVSATNSNFRMHRVWKVDKVNWGDANVTFKFGEDFANNYLLIASDAAISTITSELQLDASGSVTFNSSLLGNGSYFSVGAKMQLPGCVAIPTVSYPNYQEYYNHVVYPYNNPIGYGYNTNLTGTQDIQDKMVYSGYYPKNFTNSFTSDNYSMVYRARLNITSPGSYTFYMYSDDNGDIYVDGDLVASVYTCCYETSGAISLAVGQHDVEVRQSEGGGADYVRVRYSGPGVTLQELPVSALTTYTAPGIQTWLKGDVGVVTSGGVTRWNDVSGNNNDAYQTNASYNPTYNSGNSINFNPSVATAGSQGMLFKKTIPSTNNLQVFAVGKYSTAATRTLLRGSNAAPAADHFVLFHPNNTLSYYDNNNVGYKFSGQTATVNQPYLIGMAHNAAANTAQPRFNGKNGTVLTNINEDDVDHYQDFMNWIWQGGDQPIGDVAEFIAVSGTLSPTDIQKIESYLALKYGITLDQTTERDYLSSTGTTMWDASDNGIYKNDIAGIGKDLCQGLHQKQSKSVNGDDPITIAIGDTIMPTNAANTSSVTNDLSFLTWANNDGNITNFNTTVSASGIQATTRIARVWKVDKTNWNNTPNLTINFQGANAQYYLLISNDPTFATGVTEYRLNGAGNRTFPASALADGAYFTFGKRVAGPACVNTGIALWLRADDGTASDSLWEDYSGNEVNAAQSTGANQPAISNNAFNFNPGFLFDGTNDSYSLSNISNLPYGNPNISVVAVASSNNSAGWRFIYAHGNNATNQAYVVGKEFNTVNFVDGAWSNYNVTSNVWVNNEVKLIGSTHSSTTNQQRSYVNGRNVTTATRSYNIVQDDAYIGAEVYDTPAEFWSGTISEVIVYSKELSALELQKINSYLSIKYGITLDQTSPTDYVASDWNGTTGTKMWDASVNGTYKYDIAGIGKDICTGLHQKQSKSVNSGNLITMALGNSVAASNQANANTVTNDLSFLVWGHNNGSTSFGPTVTGVPNATARMSRVWKVDKTNWADQNITICAGQTGDRYLLINATDAAFGAGTTEYAMNFSTGCVTINSSALADGVYFTLGTKIVGPACVNAGIAAWFRADYNGTATSWIDFSGNSRNTTGVYQSWTPNSTGANFNPYLDNGAASAYYNLNGIYSSPGIVNTKIFAVNLPVNGGTTMPFSERMNNGDNIRLYSPNSDGIMYWDAPYGYRVSASFAGNGGTYGAPNLFVGERTPTNMAIRLNGKTAISTNGTFSSFTTAGGAYAHIGANWGWSTYANNRIAEVVVYKDASAMTPVEIQRIESYLALKYGITLNTNTDGDGTPFEVLTGTNPANVTEGDYVASDGTTIYWDASANTGYNSYVAGIGRDDCTDLNQKQSKSVNTGAILTGALGSTVAVSNAANTNTITTDNSYLVWGNNNGLNEYTTQVTGTNVTSVLGRVWRVDKTNWTDQNITLCFDNYNDDDYLVISNSSATFATISQEKQLSSLGCVTFSSADLPDGAYFSLGKNIVAPGCVTGGIVTWLDAQTVASGNMIDGVGWSDKSGNNKYFNWVFGDPARTDAALNYNHVINFDGDDWLRSTQSPFVNNFTAGEALVITKSNGQFVGQGHPYDFGSGSRGNHLSWGDSHYYDGFGTTDRLGFNPENNTIVDGKPGVASITGTNYIETNWNLIDNYSAPNDWGVGFNGLFKATTTTNTVSFSLNVNNEHIADNGSNNRYTGDIAEVILYRRKLTAPERQKVMSYLALKYGITLDTTVTDQDYVAADGTIFWDWADNNNYQHDIAGIGREDCQQLNQKQSKSINGDDPLAIAAGNFTTFPVSNEANTTTITNDKSFLVWSNNNGALTFTTAVPKIGINGTFRTPRAWKIDKTNFADQMLTISVGQSGERYLLVDEDGSGGFENDANTKEYAFDFTTGLLNISSLNLPDGAVITLATKISGPGCVNSGIVAWLRADYGAANDGTGKVSSWADFSGNNKNFTQVTQSQRPSLNTVDAYSNFNPTIYYNYTTNYLQAATNLWSAGQPGSGFAVAYHANVSGPWGHLIDQNDDITLLKYNGLPNMAVFDNGVIATYITSPQIPTMQNNIAGVFGLDFGTTANSYRLHFNGLTGGVTSAAPSIVNNVMRIGMQVDNTDPWQGGIPEVIIYNRQLTAVELQRVNSYLALKYGITLTTDNDGDATAFETISGSIKEGDYVASDGSTIYWNASANNGYNSNIAGIGLDVCTELAQKQSKSVNTGEILSGALGSAVQTSNLANTTAFADSDLSFLVWGHNNGNNDFDNTVTATGTTSMAYLGRVWRAQKTNFSDQNITLCFSGYNADEYLLISNSSATFATVDHEAALDANGCVTFNSSFLSNGAYFTLGKNIQGPACVDGGIKLWLRADDGIVTDSSWVDYSGNSRTAAQGTVANRPVVSTTNGINFNPSLNFDGSNDNLAIPYDELTGLPTGNQSRTAFYVGYLNTNSGEDFAFGYGYEGLTNQSFEMGHTVGNAWYENWGSGMFAGAGTYPAQRTLINMWRHDNTVNPSSRGYLDNKQIASQNMTLATSLGVGAADPFYIGRHNHDVAPRYWDGKISEIIIYNRALSATEVQKVNSYLALKYGITIDQTTPTDYIASDGSNIWNAANNGAYKVDIAGLGKDICTNLNQKQSKSVNANRLITIALGSSVASTNSANPNTITNDKSFFVWANNGLATTFTTSVPKTGISSTNRTPRVWKVDKTNWADQNITICVGQTGERYLLIDKDNTTGVADFADDANTVEYALGFSTGCVTINSSELPDGATFSLGTKISGPACVNTGIVAWLRADYGANGVNWSDYSGNSNNPTATSDPDATTTTYINFNPAFYYDGNDVHTMPASADLTTGNYSIMTVSRMEGTQNARVFSTSTGNDKLFGYWSGSEDQLYLFGWLNGPGGIPATTRTKMYSLQRGGNPYEFRDANRIIKTGATSDGTTWRLSIGAANSGAAEPSKVYVPEVAIYNADLSATDVNKIESYFGLKYGITLDQTTNTDYVASNWNGTTGTKMWTNDNDNFEYDIAGIGKDVCTELEQKQSASANTGNILTVALGSTVQTTNALNTNSVTNDLSFLTWAHNNGTLDFTTTAPGINATARLARVWKVDKTNWADQQITICFGATYANNYLIINNTDAAFATVGLEYQLDANGCYTLNSSDLPDGAYFTVGKNLEGPACVNGGIKAWLRADDGISSVSQWSDYSGNTNDFTQATVSEQPTLISGSAQTNFNPAFSFVSTNNFEKAAGVLTNGGGTVVAAVMHNNITATYGDIYNQNIDDPTFGKNAGNASPLLWDNGVYTATVPGTFIQNQNHIASFDYGSTANSYTTYFDGKANNVSHGAVPSIESGIAYIGGENTAESWLGNIYEVAIFSKELTASELQRVHSYFALKYGVTLDQTTATNYVASDGTVYWDATANSAYNKDIAGLGKDDCTNLHQKQSKSVNANSLISIATGSSVAATNAANTVAVTNDKSFFVWGNNGLATTFTTAVSGLTNTTARTPRVWKVDKTNWQDQNITICVGQTGERYLLINATDPAFGAGTTEYAMNFSTGCVTINSSLLPDGAYFSLGTKISGPACVNTGIQVWLRSDYGTGTTTDGTFVSGWSDFSGNTNTATQATAGVQPTYEIDAANLINYQPVVKFDGSNDYLENTTATLLSNTSATLFAVVDQTAYTTWGGVLYLITAAAIQVARLSPIRM